MVVNVIIRGANSPTICASLLKCVCHKCDLKSLKSDPMKIGYILHLLSMFDRTIDTTVLLFCKFYVISNIPRPLLPPQFNCDTFIVIFWDLGMLIFYNYINVE